MPNADPRSGLRMIKHATRGRGFKLGGSTARSGDQKDLIHKRWQWRKAYQQRNRSNGWESRVILVAGLCCILPVFALITVVLVRGIWHQLFGG